MTERYFRIYKKYFLDEVKSHLMTYGALSGTCASCKEMDIKLDDKQCPSCKTTFKFVAFQNIKDHMPKVQRLSHERPEITFMDYDDFKRVEGEEKARGILE